MKSKFIAWLGLFCISFSAWGQEVPPYLTPFLGQYNLSSPYQTKIDISVEGSVLQIFYLDQRRGLVHLRLSLNNQAKQKITEPDYGYTRRSTESEMRGEEFVHTLSEWNGTYMKKQIVVLKREGERLRIKVTNRSFRKNYYWYGEWISDDPLLYKIPDFEVLLDKTNRFSLARTCSRLLSL